MVCLGLERGSKNKSEEHGLTMFNASSAKVSEEPVKVLSQSIDLEG
jgi:hypothetical protein